MQTVLRDAKRWCIFLRNGACKGRFFSVAAERRRKMHIPDGYLSPQTFVPMYALMAPIWLTAARKVRQTLRTRHVPFLALGAAFSFVVMMFNIPVPGGTSGHAVGSALVAILLGPWAACMAVSLAL